MLNKIIREWLFAWLFTTFISFIKMFWLKTDLDGIGFESEGSRPESVSSSNSTFFEKSLETYSETDTGTTNIDTTSYWSDFSATEYDLGSVTWYRQFISDVPGLQSL